MFFVHPQLKFNISNLLNLFFCFLKRRDKEVSLRVEKIFPGKRIHFTDMGRSAFRLIVEELGLQNSQILVPAYICDIFYELFKAYNIFPVFLDIEKETFNINPVEIEEKINPKVKSILICHTYGLPVDLDKILVLAKKHNLKIIEDCAHSFGATRAETLTGNFGDAAFFSLYKLFPTLRGGMAVLPARRSIGEGGPAQKEINLPKTYFSPRDLISLLNCFPCFSFLFKKYAGEIAPKYLRKEKLPRPAQLNRVSLNIFDWHLKNFERVLEKRRELGLAFQQELKKLGFEVQRAGGSTWADRTKLNPVRDKTPKASAQSTAGISNGVNQFNTFTFLSVLAPNGVDRDKFVVNLRKKRVFATRIWHTPIILNKEAQKEYKIELARFPNTVEVAQRIVNFPLQNFYTEKDVKKIIKKIRDTITEKTRDIIKN